MDELSIVKQYPPEKFNLLGNTMVATKVPEIMAPVSQVVKLSPNPDDGDVYIHDKSSGKRAITKNGLNKLSDGAGIKMISSEHVLPTTCQKCAAVNRSAGRLVQCGTCSNKDVAFKVTISVPQLTGEVLYVADTNEINVDDFTSDMTKAQKAQFMKYRNQICEAKALNGAIRTALHIKASYTVEELNKPFVVAYLVPNMDNEEVKQTAINHMFQSSANLFGESSHLVLDAPAPASVDEEEIPDDVLNQFVDAEYIVSQPDEQEPAAQPAAQQSAQPAPVQTDDVPMCCEKCGAEINEKVFSYSVNKYGRPLCYKCQRS